MEGAKGAEEELGLECPDSWKAESPAPDKSDQFDGVALMELAVGVVAFGDEGLVDLDCAGGVVEAEVVDEGGEGGAFGDVAGCIVDDDAHGGW